MAQFTSRNPASLSGESHISATQHIRKVKITMRLDLLSSGLTLGCSFLNPNDFETVRGGFVFSFLFILEVSKCREPPNDLLSFFLFFFFVSCKDITTDGLFMNVRIQLHGAAELQTRFPDTHFANISLGILSQARREHDLSVVFLLFYSSLLIFL